MSQISKIERIISNRTRVKIIDYFLNHPEREFYISQVVIATNSEWSKAQREIYNLKEAGFLLDRPTAYKHYFYLNRYGRISSSLKNLFETLSKN